MNLEKLLLLLNAWKQPELDGVARESVQSAGSTYLRERLTIIAERACRDFPGDLVEIGCLNGSTTVRLAEVAKEHGRKVIAIDPYKEGTQNCTGAELPRFLDAIAPYKDVVEFLRSDSRSPFVYNYLVGRQLAMAFVDGLHEYQACLSDIHFVHHAALIVVDDWTWNEGIERAIVEATGNRQRIMHKPFHEAYLL